MAQRIVQKALAILLPMESRKMVGDDERKTLEVQRMQELEADYLQNLKHLQRVVEEMLSQAHAADKQQSRVGT